MKKLIILVLFACGFSGFSQNDAGESLNDNVENVWEIKGNAFYLVLGVFEATIERSLNEESAIGVSGMVPFDKDVKEDVKYLITPYYRLYFGEKYAAGFFVEGFGMLNEVKEDFEFDDFSGEEEQFVTDFALGVGLGGKWVTKRGFVGELNFGIGRNLFNANEHGVKIVAKLGINVGYRF